MLNYLIGGAIFIQVLILLMFWFLIARRHLQMSHAYPLYAVRDKFVFLVAAGKLKEQDPIFNEFYKVTNIMIQNSKALTLRRVVNAVEEAKRKGFDPADKKRVEEIVKALQKLDDPLIKDAVFSFYEAMYSLFLSNSKILRIETWLHYSFIPRITEFQKRVSNIFESFQQARTVLHCPT